MTKVNTSSIEHDATRIVNEGTDVRTRIRDLVLDTVRERRLELGDLREVLTATLRGTETAMRKSLPDEPVSGIRDVFDGLRDAVATSAHATELAFREAKGRQEAYADDDLARTTDDLKTLESMFVKTVESFGKSFSELVKTEFGDLIAHVKRTAVAIRPSAEKALKAADDHKLALAKETVGSSAKLARHATGQLMLAVSGLLEGAAKAIAGDEEE